MAKDKKQFKFDPGDRIYQNKKPAVVLVIEYLDLTRNVYIFEGLWVHNLSEFKSYDTDYIDKNFTLT